MLKKVIAGLLAMMMLFSFTSCARTEKQTRSDYTLFDTVSTVTAYTDKNSFDIICDTAFNSLGEINRLTDIYHDYSEINNLKTVNDNAGISPVQVDDRLLEFAQYAVYIYELTGGKVNVMMGAVLKIWHSCREEGTLPDDGELNSAGEHCDINALVIDRDAGTLYISDPLASIDAGAIAKGWAEEWTAKILITAGFDNIVLDVGGNVRTIGTKPDGEEWNAGIEDPDGEKSYVATVRISGGALATSGNYQRYFEVDGVRYHHIIDPDTLYPAGRYKSVTVLAPDSGLADALSTALFNMDYESGKALTESLDGVYAYWICLDGTVYSTGAFTEYGG